MTVKRCGGREIDVIVAPRLPDLPYFAAIIKTLWSLLKGMKVTLRYFLRPSQVVTRQYPENRAVLKLTERSRGQLRLIKEEGGYHRCPGCKICEKACPNGSITIDAHKGVSKKTELKQFIWRLDACTFCNACVISCPYDALTFVPNFESAVYDRRLLIFNLNDYVGPPAKFLKELADEKERSTMMQAWGTYEGPLPMSGVDWDGVPALGKRGQDRYGAVRPKKVEAPV